MATHLTVSEERPVVEYTAHRLVRVPRPLLLGHGRIHRADGIMNVPATDR